MTESSKGENNGLLAKVIKFVRNPTGWAELDVPDEARESGYSKQMLKEMIERKRRNDFVRKREFDMLRKLRRSEVIAGHDLAARPSFFQSSLPSRPDDRASTLKKIDEIEAQMSQQWWKSKQSETTTSSVTTGGTGTSALPLPPASAARVPSRPGPLSSRSGLQSSRPDLLSSSPAPLTIDLPVLAGLSAEMPLPRRDETPQARADSPTAGPTPAAGAAAPSPAPPPASASAEAGGDSVLPSSMFSVSKSAAVHVEEVVHDTELEDAAIRFAHGDDAGAEAALRALLASGGARQDHENTWLALFDLYRATGQHERFDDAAVEFASRFGRSAPQWVSLPAAAGLAALPVALAQASRTVDWTCPTVLSRQSVTALEAAMARATPPWRLSWARLNRIEETAVEPLTRLLTQWIAQPVHLHFIAGECLEELLRQQTVSNDRGVDPSWWKLRMETLRLMHQADDFELVALDYCVTYEVSPPSWERPRSQYRALAADGANAEAVSTLPNEHFRDSAVSSLPASGFGDGAWTSRVTRPAQAELSGVLCGDAAAALAKLPAVAGGEQLLISCARLLRVDFTAAGSLLNWSMARQAEGCLLQFTDVHRLIAPFFNMMGISAAARVEVRRD